MYLQEVFDQLSGGELSQTNLGEITEDKWPRVVNHVNMGLADLFKRFFLREGRVLMQLRTGMTSYPIDIKYAVANRRSRAATADRFLIDTTDTPFLGDVLKIERVLTDDGVELTLNDDVNPWSVVATDTMPPTLRVPSEIVEQSTDLPEELVTTNLEVVYRARHPKIDAAATTFDPATYEVRLPDTHLQALCYYVASRVLGPVGMGQTEGVTSLGYWKRYEAECAQLASAGVQIDRTVVYDKLRDRGFA